MINLNVGDIIKQCCNVVAYDNADINIVKLQQVLLELDNTQTSSFYAHAEYRNLYFHFGHQG